LPHQQDTGHLGQEFMCEQHGPAPCSGVNVSLGEYKKIARQIEEEFGLATGAINLEDLRRHMYSGCTKFVAEMGPKSPFAGIEAQLLTFVLVCVLIRQPLSEREGLCLANSLIAGTLHERN
jgi:hypothetical protein